MKRIVNGVEVELSRADGIVEKGHDRLHVTTPSGKKTALCVRVGDDVHISFAGRTYKVTKKAAGGAGGHSAEGSGEIHAPMPGLIIDVKISVGEEVKKGQKLVVLEAMKTQLPMNSPFDGTVSDVFVHAGDQVGDAALLVKITPL